jgi:GTP diphosphokinase / guanosine-3',5'-bis(diphosphate) 3'-diphosphatase
MVSLVEKARNYATEKHRGQFRHDKITPYITHSERVVGLLEEIGIRDEDILASGWLHDVVEDCGVSVGDLEREFNPEVARIVGALSRDVGREEYKERIRKSDYPVKIVKLADVVHNCSYLYNSSRKTIENKIHDSEDFYLPLAKQICHRFYKLLLGYVSIAKGLI